MSIIARQIDGVEVNTKDDLIGTVIGSRNADAGRRGVAQACSKAVAQIGTKVALLRMATRYSRSLRVIPPPHRDIQTA